MKNIFTNYEFYNQNLQEFLTINEGKMKTAEFFKFLEKAQADEPKNFQIRSIWVSEPDKKWVGEYKAVFGTHFNLRVWQRMLEIEDPIKIIMKQLKNNAVATAITNYPIFWDEETKQIVGASQTEAVAVVQEGLPFVPVYSAGDSFINVRTVIVKEPNMFFKKDTAVLAVDADGNVSWTREPIE
jgi:hypothetical protein